MPVFRRLLSALLLAIPFLAARENTYAHVPAPVTLPRATITAGECLGDLSGWKTEHRQPIPEQTGHSLIAPFTRSVRADRQKKLARRPSPLRKSRRKR